MAKPIAVEVRRERTVGDEKFSFGLQQEIEAGEDFETAFVATETIVAERLNRIAPDPKQQARKQKEQELKAKATELRNQKDEVLAAIEAEQEALKAQYGDVWSDDLINAVAEVQAADPQVSTAEAVQAAVAEGAPAPAPTPEAA